MSQQINLYNPLFLKQEKYFSARAMLQALAMIALGLAMFYVYALVQTRESERLAADNQAQLASQREQFTRFGGAQSAQERSKALESEVASLETEVKARRSVVAALRSGELGNTAGFSAYLAAFGRKAMPGVWLTGFSVGESGNDLEVRGRVLHPDLVPAYLRALSDEPVMRGRQVTELVLNAMNAKAAGAPPAAGAAPQPAGPERFVEFRIAAHRQVPETGKPASKPASKGSG